MSDRDVVKVPASFRGVPFLVKIAELGGGRRGVVREFPLRDRPYFDDLGRKGRAFSVEGLVEGDQYLSAKNALITALERRGPGELVHPYYGTRRVAAPQFRVRESDEEGGVARFQIDFVETDAQPSQPTAASNVSGAVSDAAASARASAQAVFVASLDPLADLAPAAAALQSAAAVLSGIAMASTLDSQGLASFNFALGAFTSSAQSQLATPADAFSQVDGLVSSIEGDALALLPLYSFGPGVRPSGSSPSRLAAQLNFDASRQMVQRLVLARASELIAAQAFTSYEEAIGARQKLLASFDDQALTATDDTYDALTQLRAAVVSAVPSQDQDLPHLSTFVPTITLPSLVIAHRLYGSVDLEADIVARNRVSHPGFVPGGVALEVLTDG